MSFHPVTTADKARIPALQFSDPSEFGRVALAVGGESAEREVSLNGGESVAAAMQRQGIRFEVFDGAPALLNAIHDGRIDRVFNLIHGPGGEDGSLQGALELLKIPVTGSDLPSSALSMDKVHSKWVWERAGISTPPFERFAAGDENYSRATDRFEFPLYVKPAGLGSSIGISRVEDIVELDAAIRLARNYDEVVIIEPEVKGNEYFCAVLGQMTLPVIRIETPREFYDYEAKYESDDTRYHCPCGLDPELEIRLRAQAQEAFEVLGCSGWGRVDFLLDENEQPWFLEVNTIPGMTDHSLVPQEAAQVGIGFDELVWRILETSL